MKTFQDYLEAVRSTRSTLESDLANFKDIKTENITAKNDNDIYIIKSYQTVIATINKKDKTMKFNDSKYSKTTSFLQSKILSAFKDFKRI